MCLTCAKQQKNSLLSSCAAHKLPVYWSLFFAIVFLLASCGKRAKSLVPAPSTFGKVARFDLPRAPRLKGSCAGNAVLLTWQPINHPRLCGYALYKFEAGRFLRHKPYARVKRGTHTLLDPQAFRKYHSACYGLRPCFKMNGRVQQGPLSNVICFAKK